MLVLPLGIHIGVSNDNLIDGRSPTRGRARSVSKKRIGSKSSSGILGEETPASTPRRPGRPRKNPVESVWINTPLKQTPPRQTTPKTKSTINPHLILTKLVVAPSRLASSTVAAATSENCSKFWIYVAVLAVVVVSAALVLSKYCEESQCKNTALWYLNWILLGAFGTIGLGNSANTWLVSLGPFIARVTSTAYICKTTGFAVDKSHVLSCPTEYYEASGVTAAQILLKVLPATLLWGFGAALAELVPYLAAALFVCGLRKTVQCEKEAPISTKLIGLIDRVKTTFGPSEALLLAAFPNPFLDTTGLLCGLFGVELGATLRALFLGKALVRSTLQASSVVLVFSKDIIEPFLAFVRRHSTGVATMLYNEISAQRQLYQQTSTVASVALHARNLVKLGVTALLVFMTMHALFVFAKYRRRSL